MTSRDLPDQSLTRTCANAASPRADTSSLRLAAPEDLPQARRDRSQHRAEPDALRVALATVDGGRGSLGAH
jgi:hypothetical protein